MDQTDCYEPTWLDVPGPVPKKKRVSKTVYWEACPACDQPISGWSSNANVVPVYRQYQPCGCFVTIHNVDD